MTSRVKIPLFLTLAVLAALPAAAIERTVKQSFPVQPGATMKVDTYRGGIVVEETEGSEMRAEIRIELATDDESEATSAIEALKLELKADDNAVRVRARNPRESRALFVWEERKRIELTFRVFVPRGSLVELSTLDGGITVGNMTGRVGAFTRAGTIFCRRIDGPIKAEVESGDITISRCTGEVNLKATKGNIRTGTMFGKVDARSSSGDIEITSAMGGVKAVTAAGDVTVGFQKGFTGEAQVSADGGSVVAKIEPTALLTLDATTSWGRVQTVLPFVVESGGVGKSKLTGKLNGGGPVVKLHAAGGHVKVEGYKQFLSLDEES